MKQRFLKILLFSSIGLSALALGLTSNRTTAQEPMNLHTLAAAHNKAIGAAVEIAPLRNDPLYGQVLASHFGMISPENAMKMRKLRPTQTTYDFGDADYIVNFAEANGMKVRANTLIWYKALPTWMENRTFTRDELTTIMQEYITTVVSRYRGRVHAWDVVNEAVLSGTGGYRPNIYYDTLGPEYIEMAFRMAHAADPNALLFYNDYSAEEINTKSDFIYNMVKGLLEKGVPIHGVGLQMHLNSTYGINTQKLAANIQRLADLGLQVHITEMDVRMRDYPGDMTAKMTAQAEIYRQVMQVCTDSPACTAFVTWGVADKYSWIDERFGADDPLLFDDNYQPKPAFHAVSQVLGTGVPVEPQPTTDEPAVLIETSPRTVTAGGTVDVTVKLLNINDLYGLQTDCQVDPNVMSASGFDSGDAFTLVDSFYVGNTVNDFNVTTGEWLVATSRLQPAPAFAGNGTAFTMRYTAKQNGTPQPNCTVLAVDSNGQVLPLVVLQGSQAPTQPEAPQQPTPAVTPQPGTLKGISGIVKYQSRPDSSGIKVELLDLSQNVLGESLTAQDGGYSLSDIASGEYTLRFSAPQHLVLLRPITVGAPDAPVTVEANRLVAGDIDENGSIDIIDAMFVASNLGLDAIPEIAYVDLNADSVINVRDLVLIGSNFGIVGPVVRTGL